MILLPRNARDKEQMVPSFMKRISVEEFFLCEEEESRQRISFEDWNNINIFMSAFKIKKPGVQSGETLLLNESQSQALAIKGEVSQMYSDILKKLEIDVNCLKQDKNLSSHVIEKISENITKFFYVRYKEFKVIQCVEILDEEFGLSEIEFSECFPEREITCIPLFSTQGKYLF